jgi:hypothetical protein
MMPSLYTEYGIGDQTTGVATLGVGLSASYHMV